MIEFHLEREADVSVAALPVSQEQSTLFGIISADADGHIYVFQEKPRRAGIHRTERKPDRAEVAFNPGIPELLPPDGKQPHPRPLTFAARASPAGGIEIFQCRRAAPCYAFMGCYSPVCDGNGVSRDPRMTR